MFVIQDIAASIYHYCYALGFDVTFDYGKPPFDMGPATASETALIARRMMQIVASRAWPRSLCRVSKHLKALGAPAPKDWPYGMRVFNISAPDGNQLSLV